MNSFNLINFPINQSQTISSMMSHSCRCHGVSGSCAVRTCWRALPSFAKVGDLLKLKYETSVEITPPPLLLLADKNRKDNKIIEKKLRRSLSMFTENRTEVNKKTRQWQQKRRQLRRKKKNQMKKNKNTGTNTGNNIIINKNKLKKNIKKNNKKHLSSIDMASLKRLLTSSGANLTTLSSLYNKRREKRKSRDPISDNELVFVSKSPNFCKFNPRLGIPGTRGRRCDNKNDGPSGCGYLCCGRGFTVLVERRVEACQCKFVWCCEVVCRQCQVVEEIPVCNWGVEVWDKKREMGGYTEVGITEKDGSEKQNCKWKTGKRVWG